MRRIELPRPVQDVVARRLRAAPSSMVAAAFGVPKLSVAAYQNDEFLLLLAGKNSFIDSLDRTNAARGTPTPWLKRPGPNSGGAMFAFSAGVRNSRISALTLQGGNTLITADSGAIFSLRSVRVVTPSETTVIENLVAGAQGMDVDWLLLAQAFEALVVEALSPHIKRLKHAT